MGAPRKIVIADDSPIDRRIFAAAVEALGYAAIGASDGERALTILNDNPDVALLITDHEMERMRGDDLIRRLRAEEKFKALPIIVISGVIKLKEVNSILEVGASRFLPKPVNIAELSEYVRQLIK